MGLHKIKYELSQTTWKADWFTFKYRAKSRIVFIKLKCMSCFMDSRHKSLAICSLSGSSADFAVIYEQHVETGKGCVSSITYVTSPQALEIAVSELLRFPALGSLQRSTGLK